MRLRKKQLDALSTDRVDAFVARMVAHLRDDLPAHCEARGLKEQDLDPLVREGMVKAEGYGITSEGGIQQYLDCMLVLGLDFDRDAKQAWAGEILRNKDLTPPQKTDTLGWQMLFEVEWEQPANG
jgi:hypothetical protein